MNIFISVLLSVIFGYLLGSISNGVLIGKIFFNIDVREQGSHNSGGTNTGRVLGKKFGLLTIILDMIKTVMAIWLTYFISSIPAVKDLIDISPSLLSYIAGIAACLGHIFPLYFGFKGGKIVSCFAGLLLATNWIIFVIGLIVFMVILVIKKYVSLASILTSIILAGVSFIPFVKEYGMLWGLEGDIYFSLLFVITSIILVIRHHQNIKRLISGTESKITWLDKKKEK